MKTTSFSQHLGTYFDEYLPNVRNYSPNTIASYQDTFRLLLEYMAEQQHIKPYLLDYKHFSDKVILSFLNWLETHRNCSPSTRNQRLSAISAFFKYASQRSISALKICSNIASIPPKKTPLPYFFILFRGGIESPAANARPQKTSGTTGHRTAESFIRQWSQGTGVMRHTSWRHSI